MIDVHVPATRPDGLRRLAESMQQFGLADAGATLSVCYGPQIDPAEFSDFPFMRFIKEQPFLWIPPMYELRRRIHDLGIEQPWMIFDDDDAFAEGSVQYLRTCLMEMERAERIFGRPIFLGTAGVFGSNHHGDRVHISPVNALMPKGHGIIFSKEINFTGKLRNRMAWVQGGLEEHLMCAMATVHFDAVPLKRFRNPAKIKFRNKNERQKSAIHNWAVWEDNSMIVIGEMANEPGWRYPAAMEVIGKGYSKSPKAWVKRAKELKKEYGDV